MSVNIVLDIPESFLKESQYILENLFFPYREEFVIIGKNEDSENNSHKIIYIYEDYINFNNIQKGDNNLYIILQKNTLDCFSCYQEYNLEEIIYINDIPCLFPLHSDNSNNKISNVFPFDLFASSFYFLSCWQEYSISERDRKGRIPLKATLQNKLGIIRIPIVNEYLRIFEKYIKTLWGITLEYKKMPGNTNNFVALSHDICRIDLPLERYLKYLFGNRKVIEKNFSNFVALGKNIWCKKNIYAKIKNLELEYGASSTYYFLSRYPRKYKNFSRYLIKLLDGTAFEIGHHISDNSIFDGSLNEDNYFFKEVVRDCYGERVHKLRFVVDKLFSQLEKSKYYYDNSLLFAEDVGYRTGFSYPHYIFDHVRKKPFKVLAIPLNVMDATLVDRKFLLLNDNLAEKELISFMENALQYGGVFSVLFHCSFFWLNPDKRFKIFESLLQFLAEKEVKVGTCRDVFLWYRKMCNPSRPSIKF
jgi:hypothetical protein